MLKEFKITMDEYGTLSRSLLGTVMQYSIDAYLVTIDIPSNLATYSWSGSCKRNDGTSDTADFAVTLNDNTLTFYISQWLADYSGNAEFTLRGSVLSGSVIVETMVSSKMIVKVNPAIKPSDWTPTTSPSSYDTLKAYIDTQLLAKVNRTYTIQGKGFIDNLAGMTFNVSDFNNDAGYISNIDKIINWSIASSRVNIVSGETLSVILGKIEKYFNDLGTFAFKSSLGSGDLPSGIVIDNAYTHTDNNFSNALKNKLDGIETNAEVNILNGVMVNSSDLVVANKKVNVLVPTNVSDLTNDSDYQTASDLANVVTDTMQFSIVASTGVLTLSWTNYDGSSKTTSINLPTEYIIDADHTYFDTATNTLHLAYVGGGYTDIPLGDLVDLYYADENTLTLYLEDNKYKFKIKDSWITANISDKLTKTGDAKDLTTTFTQADSRVNIASGEKVSISLGKISKHFTDLKSVSFSGSYNDLSDVPTNLPNKYSLTIGDTIYDGSSAKTISVDVAPTSLSNNLVKSGGVYGALSGKQDTLTFDDTPTDNSNNPVKSNGIYDALVLRELLSNKVSSIGAVGDNVNYPTEKAVRDLYNTALIINTDIFISTDMSGDATAQNKVVSPYAVKNYLDTRLSQAGYGDMLKSVFATNDKVSQGYVDKAILADSATNATSAVDSTKLNNQLPAYYLDYANFTSVPTYLPNQYSLTVGNKTYNGSSAVTIDKGDIGLGNVANPTIYGGISVTDNLNNLSFSGFYTAYGTATGVPSSSYSWFIIHENSNVGVVSASQVAISYNSTPMVYVRTKLTSTWGAWKQILTESDLESTITSLSGKAITSGAVYTALALKANSASLASVATSGSYNDLSNVPTYLPNQYNLTFGSKTYNGSSNQTIVASDLGITDIYSYKGSVATYGDLPVLEVGTSVGYTYNVVASYGTYPAGTNFAWTGSVWDALGGSVDLSSYYTKTETDNAVSSAINGKIITFNNVSVLTSAWVSDSTYTDYGYKATITTTGVTTSYSADVNLSPTDSLSGIYAPFTSTGSGVVYIWSSEVPSATITLSNIIATKVV